MLKPQAHAKDFKGRQEALKEEQEISLLIKHLREKQNCWRLDLYLYFTLVGFDFQKAAKDDILLNN